MNVTLIYQPKRPPNIQDPAGKYSRRTCTGPVLSIGEMLTVPQVLARDMVVEVEHSRLGKMKTLGPPVKFSATPGHVRRGAPQLGQHTREVLKEYGYSETEINRLVGNGDVIVL